MCNNINCEFPLGIWRCCDVYSTSQQRHMPSGLCCWPESVCYKCPVGSWPIRLLCELNIFPQQRKSLSAFAFVLTTSTPRAKSAASIDCQGKREQFKVGTKKTSFKWIDNNVKCDLFCWSQSVCSKCPVVDWPFTLYCEINVFSQQRKSPRAWMTSQQTQYIETMLF